MGCTQSVAVVPVLQDPPTVTHQKQSPPSHGGVGYAVHDRPSSQIAGQKQPENTNENHQKPRQTTTLRKHSQTNKDTAKCFGPIPPATDPVVLIVKERLFSGDSFHIKQYPSNEPFGNGLYIEGKRISRRNEMALIDGTGNVVAVCIQKSEFQGKAFMMCIPANAFPGQDPIELHHGVPLHTYCLVRQGIMGTEVYMAGKDAVPEYEIRRAGGFSNNKKLIVMKRGDYSPSAIMEGDRLTINPGRDPCLMICICAVCDEIDAEHRLVRGMRHDVRSDHHMRRGRRW